MASSVNQPICICSPLSSFSFYILQFTTSIDNIIVTQCRKYYIVLPLHDHQSTLPITIYTTHYHPCIVLLCFHTMYFLSILVPSLSTMGLLIKGWDGKGIGKRKHKGICSTDHRINQSGSNMNHHLASICIHQPIVVYCSKNCTRMKKHPSSKS